MTVNGVLSMTVDGVLCMTVDNIYSVRLLTLHFE